MHTSKLMHTSKNQKEDGEGMDGPGREEITDKSLEAAVAAAAAAGQAGTSAAAAAAFVAAAHSKKSSQHGKVGSRHELRMDHNSSSNKAKTLEPLVSSNLELVSSANKAVSPMERKSANSASRHRKRSGSKGGNGNNPGSPGSMGSRYYTNSMSVITLVVCVLLYC